MTVNQFRRMALNLPEVEELGHMDHPDFRVGGKIFATLGYPDKKWGMVKLTPEQQRIFVPANPQVFVPAPGALGNPRQHTGSTEIRRCHHRSRSNEGGVARQGSQENHRAVSKRWHTAAR